MEMDTFSVDLVCLMSDCSLELKSDDIDDLLILKKGEYLKHSTNEGLALLSDDCSPEEECSSPFLSSSIDNTAACHPGEEIWDKFEFPYDATTGSKTITNLTDDTNKCETGIKNDWDAEMWDEPKTNVFPIEKCIKEDVMWCPKSHLQEILGLSRVNKPNNLLQQPPLSPCVSTMKAEQKHSLLKINQNKSIVKTSSGNVKEVPTAKFCVSSNVLHAVPAKNCSNTVPTSFTKPHLKNAIVNSKQKQHQRYAFTAKKNMVKDNCSNNVVTKSPTNAGLNNRLIGTSAHTVLRKEQTTSVLNRNNSVDNAYMSMPSPMVQCSKRNGRVVHHGKQYSLAYSDEEDSFFVKRYINSNNMSRKRKLLLNNKPLQQLRTAVPSTEHKKWASKVMILQEAVKYCREIPYIIQEKQKILHRLQSQNKKLRETLSLLQLEMAVNRVRNSLHTRLKLRD